MKRLLLTIFIIPTIVSCRQSTTLSDSEVATVTEEVRQTLGNYYNDIRTSGLTAEFKYLDKSPEFFWVPPGFSCSLSYDSVAAILRQNAANYKAIDNSFDTLIIVPLGKDLATYTGRLKSNITDTTGKTETYLLVETGVLIRRPEGWKLLNGQTAILNK
jgi:hypothetical protein